MGKSVLHAVARTIGRSSERKRLLKLCVRKLQSIEDPETFLCRSVLINNTLKNLQTVQREAKLRKEREAMRRLESEYSEEEGCGEEDTLVPRNLNSYSAEDILSDIDMPPPLSPTLEDLGPLHEGVEVPPPTPTAAETSPLLSSKSSLSSGWMDRESLDWAELNPSSGWEKWDDSSILWERSKDELTATLDLTIMKEGEEDSRSDSSDSVSGEDGSSEGEMYEREVTCGHSYISEQAVSGISVINSLIASLES